MEIIRKFEKLDKNDISIAGGKGASLGEMTKAGIPVPAGFVILSEVFDNFVKQNLLSQKFDESLSEIDIYDNNSVNKASEIIQGSILKSPIQKICENEILKTFREIKLRNVAVRSSATVEDSLDISWAGELESYLNITETSLLDSVKKCWASLFTPRAIIYSKEKGNFEKNSVAVVVQEMINPEISGVCFTQNPVTKNKNQIVIEAGYGIGEAIVKGLITPDRYLIKKDELIIEDVNIGFQKIVIRQSKEGTKTTKLENEKQYKQKLNGRQMIELSTLCKKIEKIYKRPQDIEWTFENNKFNIVQSRPITVNL